MSDTKYIIAVLGLKINIKEPYTPNKVIKNRVANKTVIRTIFTVGYFENLLSKGRSSFQDFLIKGEVKTSFINGVVIAAILHSIYLVFVRLHICVQFKIKPI